jgi:hypothetical protein
MGGVLVDGPQPRLHSTVAFSLWIALAIHSPASAFEGSIDVIERVYESSDERFANPERGLYVELDDRRGQPLDSSELERLRVQRISLVQRLYYLHEHRGAPIAETRLQQIRDDFESLRVARMKCVLRFAYCWMIGDSDAPIDVVRKHVAQLTPLLRDNADLIVTMQAGFIGAWGEWHSSSNGLDRPEAMRDVATLLLEALPAGRTIQVRTPLQKQRVTGAREPLALATIDRASHAARVGHHNDCFLADETDTGTYRPSSLDADRDYVAADSRFVPVGGETCRLGERSDPAFAREELARMHWSFLNLAYHRAVIAKWRDAGFLDEVERRLGYRLELVRASAPREVEAGSKWRVRVTLRNVGWAAPINARPVTLRLRRNGAGEALEIAAGVDVRDWFAGETQTLTFDAPIDPEASAGDYHLAIALPDPSPRLAAEPDYAVRFANPAAWSVERGENDLGLRVRVVAASRP